jgi:hypothetical protein
MSGDRDVWMNVMLFMNTGERIYISTVSKFVRQAARELCRVFVLTNIYRSAFLLANEEQITEYQHIICYCCKNLIFCDDRSTKCGSCRKRSWCVYCAESGSKLIFANVADNIYKHQLTNRQKSLCSRLCTRCGIKEYKKNTKL